MKDNKKHKTPKQVFSDDLPLPPHLEWEQMKEGLLEEVSTIKATRQRRKQQFYATLLLLVLTIILGLNLIMQEEQENQIEPNQTERLTTTNNTKTTKQNLSKEELVLQDIPVPLDLEQPQKAKPNTNSVSSQLQIAVPDQHVEQQKIVRQAQIRREDAEIQVSELKEDEIETVAILPTLEISIIPEGPDLTFERRGSADPAIKTTLPNKYSLYLVSGVNSYQANYSGSNEALVGLRQTHEFKEWGYQFELGIERRINAQFYLGLGAALQQYRYRFDFSGERTFGRSASSVLIGFNINPITMDTSNYQRVDTVVQVRQLRRVVHYNQVNSLEVPIYLGTNFERGRFRMALFGGLSTSIFRQAKGKTFDADLEIQTAENLTGTSFSTGLSFAVLGGGNLDYTIGQNLHLRFGVSHKKFLNNWIKNANNLTARPSIWQFSFGIRRGI